MTKTVQDILTRAEDYLNDAGHVRWPATEVMRAINDGQLALLEAKPDLFQTTTNQLLAEGNVQTIPADGYVLFDVMWNVAADNTQGKRITFCKKSVLDRQRRAWSESGANSLVRHWTQDKKQRREWYCAPRQPSGESNKVYMRYAKYPVKVTAAGDNLSIPDEAINALYYFVMMRCMEKDSKFSGTPEAQRFGQMFAVIVTGREETEAKDEAYRAENEG